MSISTLRRQVKNVAYNFSDAQVKVREATSNDPWGPTTALMSEIADLTHNPMSFTEIMSMLWKRLNDHGKNWRHVYKSLVLLDYLIKCGSEKVAQQCRENIYSIETLKDFQHVEESRDQGLNVREKAKQMVALLHDEERLKNERARFLLTRKRLIQNGSGISSDGTTVRPLRRGPDNEIIDSEFEEARPSSLGEEEMQLQIAMALSREECEKEEEARKSDAIRLQIALEESKRNAKLSTETNNGQKLINSSDLSQNAIDDLLSLGLGQPTTITNNTANNSQTPSTSAQAAYNNGGSGLIMDPWGLPEPPSKNDNKSVYPNLLSTSNITPSNDPWAPATLTNEHQHTSDIIIPLNSTTTTTTTNITSTPLIGPNNDPWSAFESSTSSNAIPQQQQQQNNFEINTTNNLNGDLPPSYDSIISNNSQQQQQNNTQRNVKTPDHFLGENSALVNLDNLMGPKTTSKPASNPFVLGSSSIPATVTNPFTAQQRPSPSLNEMMNAQRSVSVNPTAQQQQQIQQQQQQIQSTHSTSLLGNQTTNPFAL